MSLSVESREIDFNIEHATYNYEMIVTYAYYDSKFKRFIRDLEIDVPEKLTAEFWNDEDILEYLFKTELCSAFYTDLDNMKILGDLYDDLFDKIKNTPLFDCLVEFSQKEACIKHIISFMDDTENANEETTLKNIFPYFFSYDLLFFTHMCLKEIYLSGTVNDNTLRVFKNVMQHFFTE